jgi:hypothetical protein
MPSKSKAQRNLMAAVANNPKFAKKAGIPQNVGADYMKADKKVKKYNMGGRLKSLRNEVEASERVANTRPKDARERMDKSEELSRLNRAEKRNMNMGGEVMKYNAGGSVGDGICSQGRTKGRFV